MKRALRPLSLVKQLFNTAYRAARAMGLDRATADAVASAVVARLSPNGADFKRVLHEEVQRHVDPGGR